MKLGGINCMDTRVITFSLMALFLIMFMSLALYYSERTKYYSTTELYSGHLYIDEECNFMKLCGAESPYGFKNESNTDISSKYHTLRGLDWCSPVEITFRGAITSPGEHGFIGPDGEPYPEDVTIYEVTSMAPADKGLCKEEAPFPRLINTSMPASITRHN